MKKIANIILTISLVMGLMTFVQLPINSAEIQYSTISVGGARTAVIKKDYSLWIFGVGSVGDGTTENRYTPIKIMDDVVQVTTKSNHTAAIKSDGSLWTWGGNQYGQLGDGTTERRLTPVKIMDDIIYVSVGNNHTAAIKSDRSLWMWGYNWEGQIGDGTKTDKYNKNDKLTPVKVMDDVIYVMASSDHTVVIKSDGSLWTWGGNQYGQLGDGTTERRLTPVKIMDNVSLVTVGYSTTAAIKSDGSLWMWGWNFTGELGDGTTEDKYNPVKIMDDVVCVSIGSGYTAAIKGDNSFWAWGANNSGQLGTGTRTSVSYTPTKIMDDVVCVSSGEHTAIIKSDGSLWAWGANYYGQLGDGTTENKLIPIKIMTDVMLPSNVSFAPIKTTSNNEASPYIYDSIDIGDSLSLPYNQLATVNNQQSAAYVVSSALVDLTADQRNSSTAIDKITHFSESAITNAASTKVLGSNINITYDDVAPLYNVARSTGDAVNAELRAGNIQTTREMNDNVRFVTDSANLNVTLNSSVYASDADNIIVENGAFGVKIPVNLVDENLTITLSTEDTNLYSFGPRTMSMSAIPLAITSGARYQLVTSKKLDGNITISLPAMSGDTTYQAIQNGNGVIVGGKYNPNTNMLEAKVNEGGSYSVVTNEKNFGDINEKATEMQKAIKYLASKGVINGRTEAEFDPNSSISRAEITALIMRALSKVDPNADGNFNDVKSSDWYFGAIGSAKRYRIVNGMSETTFEPMTIIKKDQILAIAARTLVSEMKYKVPSDINSYLSEYNDRSSLADWSLSDLALATRENLVVRRVDGKFQPTDSMTRGDAAIILYRMFLKIW